MKWLFIPLLLMPIIGSAFQKKKGKQVLPVCLTEKIKAFKKLEKHLQPQNVFEYLYRGKKVYYVTMPCCDNFNELYDRDCRLMGYPDGGFTGKGDGKIPGFTNEKKAGKLIWKSN